MARSTANRFLEKILIKCFKFNDMIYSKTVVLPIQTTVNLWKGIVRIVFCNKFYQVMESEFRLGW